jgi:alpha,alpha-trehalase
MAVTTSRSTFEIDCYGHVPNGNRTYYLTRSQPPFFSLMVDLIAEREGEGSYLTHLPELESEYEYWMDGSAFLQRGQEYRRLVRLANGTILNRYWDDRAAPRDESYREDVKTALGSRRDPGDLYRNLRAAAESGWDFSSRWFADGHSLNTIRTVSLLPVDLNSLMVHLEQTLAKAAGGDSAPNVERAVGNVYRLRMAGTQSSPAGYRGRAVPAVPPRCDIASSGDGGSDRAPRAANARRCCNKLVASGQQWDQPNGWAPLQWVAVVGLKTTICRSWWR